MRDLRNKDAMREAVSNLVDQPESDRPYDEISDLIGCVTGLPADLSERTGERFAKIMQHSF